VVLLHSSDIVRHTFWYESDNLVNSRKCTVGRHYDRVTSKEKMVAIIAQRCRNIDSVELHSSQADSQ